MSENKKNNEERIANIRNILERFQKTLDENTQTSSNEENLLSSMKTEMLKIIDYFNREITSFNEIKAYELIQNYISRYNRILYSEISSYIYSLAQSQKNNDASELNYHGNIEKFTEYCLQKDPTIENEVTKISLKMWDHFNLATHQYSNLKTNSEEFRHFITPIVQKYENETTKQITSTKHELDQIKEELFNSKKELFTQLISIVSIFVGIAFVMFGGMSLLNSLFDFSNMEKVPLIEMICLGSLLGIIMVTVMYAFIIFTLRLSLNNYAFKSPFRKSYLFSITTLVIIFSLTLFLWFYMNNINIQNFTTTIMLVLIPILLSLFINTVYFTYVKAKEKSNIIN